MAGLNFPGNADYKEIDRDKNNIAPFGFIQYILSKYSNIKEVKNELWFYLIKFIIAFNKDLSIYCILFKIMIY